MTGSFSVYSPITKFEEQPDGSLMVFGRATQEVVDSSREIMDYESSAPFFQRRSKENFDRSGGQNLMPLRSMHQSIAAGKVVQLDYLDAEKAIDIASLVVDENEIKKVKAGVYTGFSVGGKYARRWPDPAGNGVRYTADPREISLVDAPAVPTAKLTLFKFESATEDEEPEWLEGFKEGVALMKQMREQEREELEALEKSNRQNGERVGIKRRDGSPLKPQSTMSSDPDEYGDPANWKFPRSREHVSSSIESFNRREDLEKYETQEIHVLARRLTAAGKEMGYFYDPVTQKINRKEEPKMKPDNSIPDFTKMDVGQIVNHLKSLSAQAAVSSDPASALAMLQGHIDALNIGTAASMTSTPIADPSIPLKKAMPEQLKEKKEETEEVEETEEEKAPAVPAEEDTEAPPVDVYKRKFQKMEMKIDRLAESVGALVEALSKRSVNSPVSPQSPVGALNSLVSEGTNAGTDGLSANEAEIVKALEAGGPYALLKALKAAGADDEIGGALAWQNMNNAIRKATYNSLERGGVITSSRYGSKLFNNQ